ncbi:MAG: hypothetical protein ACJ8CG_00600 [Microvirga sp.]
MGQRVCGEKQPCSIVRRLVSIRLVRRRAQGLGLVLPEPGQWGAALEAYFAEIKVRRERAAWPWAEAA